MIDAAGLVDKYAPISDQVSRQELVIILKQLDRVLTDGVAGDVVEFGCYRGTTSLYLGRVLLECSPERKLWLYDSFQGLPDKTEPDRAALGDEFQPGQLAATKAEVLRNFAHANLPRPIIRKGWFRDLAPADVPDQIAFAYFDGDYYDSIRDSFRLCQDRFSPGAIIVVDDYDNSRLPGAGQAVDEWLAAHRPMVRSFATDSSLGIIRLVV